MTRLEGLMHPQTVASLALAACASFSQPPASDEHLMLSDRPLSQSPLSRIRLGPVARGSSRRAEPANSSRFNPVRGTTGGCRNQCRRTMESGGNPGPGRYRFRSSLVDYTTIESWSGLIGAARTASTSWRPALPRMRFPLRTHVPWAASRELLSATAAFATSCSPVVLVSHWHLQAHLLVRGSTGPSRSVMATSIKRPRTATSTAQAASLRSRR